MESAQPRLRALNQRRACWLSVRVKVTLGVVVPMLLIFSLFTMLEYRRFRRDLLDNLTLFASYSAQIVETNLRHQMVEADNAGMQRLPNTLGARAEFETVYVLNTDGAVVYAPSADDVTLKLDNREAACQPCHALPVAERPESIVVTLPGGQRVFRSMYSLENKAECARCHGSDGRLLGLLLTDISLAPIEAPLAASLRSNLWWWAGTLLVTIAIVNVVVSRGVLDRLEQLTVRISDFGQGRIGPSAPAAADEIGQMALVFDDMAVRIEQRRQENQGLSESLRLQSAQRGELLQRLISAQEDERRRIARGLHDDLGQTLSGLALRVEVARRLLQVDPDRALQQLDEIEKLLAHSTGDMYDIILDLRPSALDDLGLAPALRAFCERLLAGKGLTYTFDDRDLTQRLPPEIETVLFRLFQEALSNVVRHARAGHVTVRMALAGGVFQGTIADDGQGFEPHSVRLDGSEARGLGLLGMQERVAHCGGMIVIASATAQVDAVVYYRVVNAEDAIIKVRDYNKATGQIALTTLRSVLGQSDLDDLLAHRDIINDKLRQYIDDHTEPWGVEAGIVEVKDVLLPERLQRTMARQAEAEREKRAKIIHADGERLAAVALSEAADQLAKSPTSLQLRYLQTLVEISSEQNATILPIPLDIIRQTAQAFRGMNGAD